MRRVARRASLTVCGIAGFYGSFDATVLKGMTDAVAHRGPDDAGYETLGAPRAALVGLGHRRLSIIDVSGGHQPMWSRDRKAAIVYNGEIYNFRELRAELERLGRGFATRSDTEVILEGWLAWGSGVVRRLEGMFAFGLWDEARRCWFLARDRFGIKPLYYCEPAPESFAFGSEVRTLLPLVGGARVNRSALYDYLLFGWSSSPDTIFERIRQLPPAHTLIWEPGARPRLDRYWRLARRPERRTAGEWAEAVRAHLDAAVTSHLVADVPVGVTLSGGLDSSAVLASMVRSTPADRVAAFTIGWGLPDDEMPFARRAAAHLGVSALERVVSLPAMASEFARCVWHLEEPIAHPVMLTTLALARFVREHLKVVLIGEGSDELFAGYPQYRLLSPPWVWAPRRLVREAFLAVSCVMPRVRTIARLLAPAMSDRDLLESRARQFDPYFEDEPVVDGAQRFELEQELVQQQLARVDKLMMAYSVEARVPFLDRALAETAFAAPFALKVRGAEQKHVLREAVASRLPADIVRRPKTGRRGTQALLPTLLRAVRDGPLRHLVDARALANRGWFDPTEVERFLGAAARPWVARHPVESRRRAKVAWALAVLEQWARLFLDGEAVTEAPSP